MHLFELKLYASNPNFPCSYKINCLNCGETSEIEFEIPHEGDYKQKCHGCSLEGLLKVSHFSDGWSHNDSDSAVNFVSSLGYPLDEESSLEDKSLGSRLVEDFKIEKHLGSGGAGEVFLCTHKLDKREYAVKRYFPSVDSGPWIEISALSRMNHPNVVRYYQAWQEAYFDTGLSDTIVSSQENTGLCLCVQMEKCLRTLDDVLRGDYVLKIPLALRWFRELASGLTCIHKHGLIHMDLKPDNIFVDSQDQLKIGDFDISYYCPDYDKSGEVALDGVEMKKPYPNHFSAPEMKSSIQPTQKADIYSLAMVMAVLFYENSQSDDQESDDQELLAITGLKGGVPPSSLSEYPDLQSFLLMMGHEDPDVRPSAEDIFDKISI